MRTWGARATIHASSQSARFVRVREMYEYTGVRVRYTHNHTSVRVRETHDYTGVRVRETHNYTGVQARTVRLHRLSYEYKIAVPSIRLSKAHKYVRRINSVQKRMTSKTRSKNTKRSNCTEHA